MVVEEDPTLNLAFPPIASPEGGQVQLIEVSPGALMGILGSAACDLPQELVKRSTMPLMDSQPRLSEVLIARGQILTSLIYSDAVARRELSLIPKSDFKAITGAEVQLFMASLVVPVSIKVPTLEGTVKEIKRDQHLTFVQLASVVAPFLQ